MNELNNEFISSLADLAIESGLSGGSEHKRVCFDLYVTFTYMGFLNEDPERGDSLINYGEVLEAIPKTLYPCDIDVADKYYISSNSINRIVKNYTSFVIDNLPLSGADYSVLTEVVNSLPRVASDINFQLVNELNLKSSLSTRAINHLLGKVTDDDSVTKSILVFKHHKNLQEDGARYVRNTRPSIPVIGFCKDEKTIKALSNSIVIYWELLCRLFGFAELRQLVALSRKYHGKKIESLFGSDELFDRFVLRLLQSRFEEESENAVFFTDVFSDSELYRLLYAYLQVVGGMSLSDLSKFISRYIRFKGISQKKGKASSKINYSALSETFDDELLSESFLERYLLLFDYISLSSEKVLSLRPDAKVSLEDDNYPAYVEIGLLFLESGGRFHADFDQKHYNRKLARFYSEKLKQDMLTSIECSNGFFAVEGDSISVGTANITYADNRRGRYLEPEYTELMSEILSLQEMLKGYVESGQANFRLLSHAFDKTWKSKENSLPDVLADTSHPEHEGYFKDRLALISNSDLHSAKLYLEGNIRSWKRRLRSLNKYYKYLEACDKNSISPGGILSDYNVSIGNVEARMDKWEDILSKEIWLLDELPKMGKNPILIELQTSIDELKLRRSELYIPFNKYKAHLLVHDFVRETSSCTRTEVEGFISDFCSAVAGKFKGSARSRAYSSSYSNLKAQLKPFIEHHPFALPAN